MLFKWLNDKGEHEDIYVLNPVLKSFKQFYPEKPPQERLSDFQMRFVILCADPFSPLILLHGREQKIAAAKILGIENEMHESGVNKFLRGEIKKVEKAIEFYRTHIAPPKYNRYKLAHEALESQYTSILETLNHRQNDEIVGDDGKKRKKTPEDYLKLQEQCNKILKDNYLSIILKGLDEYEEKMNMHKIDISKWGIEFEEKEISIDSINTKDI